ncbi:MAG: methyltransferase [Chloroflexota bacterium]
MTPAAALATQSEILMDSRKQTFILQNTRLQPVPLTSEIRLYLASEIVPLWRMTQVELGATEVPPPFWAFAWVGGQALARYLLDHPPEVAGRRVTDFAAGSGLCGIAAMKAGAASVLAADIDPFCGDAIASNADANGVRVAFTDRDLLDAAPPDTDVILAGDICYEGPLATRVLAWLHEAHTRGTRVLIGDPGRAYFPRESMIRLADYQVPASRDLEDVEVKAAGVFTFADAAR